MKQLYYTGIGSRDTPEKYLAFMNMFGFFAAKLGWVLRSGAAPGADQAFEKGCDRAGGDKEIYLPWKNFDNNNSVLCYPEHNKETENIAKRFHPAWSNLTQGVKKLMMRNSYQVLGQTLAEPSSFVVCYTNPNKGGTTQALRIAKEYNG